MTPLRKSIAAVGLMFLLSATCADYAMSQPLPQTTPAGHPRQRAAILIFDGVQIIDYAGPWEILDSQFDVFTVGDKPGPITTSGGMSVNPTYTIENAPKAEVLVVPGGGSSRLGMPGVGSEMANTKVIRWVQKQANDATYVMSVCNGAFILAQAGLLDGQVATTTAGFIDLLKTVAPRTRVVADQRFVDNGKIITTAGLSSGIDGALHVIDRVSGRGQAQFVAVNTEYNWDPSGQFVRAQLGDMPMLSTFVQLKFQLHAQPVRYDTSREFWRSEWSLETKQSVRDLMAELNETVANRDHWSRVNSGTDDENTSYWTISSPTWGDWKASVHAEAASISEGQMKITIRVDRTEPKTSN